MVVEWYGLDIDDRPLKHGDLVALDRDRRRAPQLILSTEHAGNFWVVKALALGTNEKVTYYIWSHERYDLFCESEI
jgi:hypothetical protein